MQSVNYTCSIHFTKFRNNKYVSPGVENLILFKQIFENSEIKFPHVNVIHEVVHMTPIRKIVAYDLHVPYTDFEFIF